jgi:hypothetical protein
MFATALSNRRYRAPTPIGSSIVRPEHRPAQSPPVRVRPMHDCFEYDSLELDRQLRQLITEILDLPPRQAARRIKTHQFMVVVQRSKKLWRAPSLRTDQERDIYSNALSDVWLYVLENFHKYDPARGAVMTWINNRLKWDIKTHQSKSWEALRRRRSDYSTGEEDVNSWIDRLPAAADGGLCLQEIGQRWRAQHAAATAIHVTGRPDINCDQLFQDKLGLNLALETWLKPRDRNTYRAMAEHYGAPLPTIASFWTNKCLPFIKDVYSDFDFEDFTQ